MGLLDNITKIFRGPRAEPLHLQLQEMEDDSLAKALQPYPAKVQEPESMQVSAADISNSFLMDASGAAAEGGRGLDSDQLRAMARVPLIAAIINTRVNQVAEFAAPSPNGDGVGFQIRHKHPHKKVSEDQLTTIQGLYEFMLSCGDPRANFENSFESFLRMLVRDSLTLDAACFEVIRTRSGQVCGFTNVDSSTIRRARMSESEKAAGRRDPEGVHFVQVVDNKVQSEFGVKDLCYGIRRPRADLKYRGYGEPELELCIGLLTNMLNAENYNAANFTNGISASGIVAVKTAMNPQLFRAFRREFYQMLSGSNNAKKTPLIQLNPDSDEDVKAINLSATNKEMEFQDWLHHVMKQICAIWAIDPVEIGFSFGDTGVSSTLSQGGPGQKVLMSRERGLRPLLRAIAYWINKYVISQIDDQFEFVFVGLDNESPADILKMDVEKVKSIMTVNEVRATYDLPPIPGGDIILDQTFVSANSGAAPAPQVATSGAFSEQDTFDGEEK